MGRHGRFLVCLVVFLVFVSSVRVCAAVSEGEARVAIESADARVLVCYKAVVEAEGVGGNVSELTAVLNEAGGLLSQAKVAYDRKEFDVAFELVSNCTSMLDGFTERAATVRDNGAGERRADFLVNVVGSAVGTVAVVIVGWVLWAYLKKRYVKVEGAV